MRKRLEVYKCEVCGNIVEILNGSQGTLVCCGQNMKLFAENTVDASREKHVPVMEKAESGLLVKVGGIAHPMEEKHYIQWIEVVDGDRVERVFLKPGQKPEAVFASPKGAAFAREYCNLHGLWKG